MKKQIALLAALTLIPAVASAQNVSYNFMSGKSEKTSKNSQPLKALINDSLIDIAANQLDISTNFANIQDNASSITALETRVSDIESNLSANTTRVAVDCSTDSISDALATATNSGQLIINISGTCTETLVIDRDNVSLVGDSGATIAYSAAITDNPYRDALDSVINVIAADNIIIENLSISGANNSDSSSGIRALNNASVLLNNVTLENNQNGIFISNNASLQMSNSQVRNNSTYGIVITDNANLQLRENNTIEHSATRDAALGAYRNVSVTVREGGNTITNTFSNGDINIALKGSVRLRANDQVEVNGDVNIQALGFFQTNGTTDTISIDGDIICSSSTASLWGINAITVTGSTNLNGICTFL